MSRRIRCGNGPIASLFELNVAMESVSDGMTPTMSENSLVIQQPPAKRRRLQRSKKKMTKKRKRSPTLEFQVPNRKKICKDKSPPCSKPTQPTQLLLTLDRGSILEDKVLDRFWTSACVEWSAKLPCFTVTDCVDLPLNSSKTFFHNTESKSWFTTKVNLTKEALNKNWQKTCSQLSQSLRQDIMEREAIKTFFQNQDREKKELKKWIANRKRQQDPEFQKRCREKKQESDKKLETFLSNVDKKSNELLKTRGRKQSIKTSRDTKKVATISRKVRIFPTTAEEAILKGWLGTSRWTYNQCINAIENDGIKANTQVFRDLYKKQNAPILQDSKYSWIFKTPPDVRDVAITEVLDAVKSNKALQRKNYKLSFRSKRDKSQVIQIQHRNFNLKTGAYAFLKNIKTSEKKPSKVTQLVKIQRTWLNQWYMIFTMPRKQPIVKVTTSSLSENQTLENVSTAVVDRVISIDPGCRTFATCYDTGGGGVNGKEPSISEWGAGDIDRIYRLCRKSDNLQSRFMEKQAKPTIINGKKCLAFYLPARTRYSLRKARKKIYQQIRNLVDEFHKKFIRWLVQTRALILLPKFNSHDFTKTSRGYNRLKGKAARNMMTWAHARFRTRLVDKLIDFPNSQVQFVNESWTSKTCGKCGAIHQKLGKNKTFQCPSCHFECDRDMNASRNILIRFLAKHQINSSSTRQCVGS